MGGRGSSSSIDKRGRGSYYDYDRSGPSEEDNIFAENAQKERIGARKSVLEAEIKSLKTQMESAGDGTYYELDRRLQKYEEELKSLKKRR